MASEQVLCACAPSAASLPALATQLLEQHNLIEGWLRKQWLITPPPFYASVDLRNAGFKLAPVDTNLFPAGFNNLDPSCYPLCIQALQRAVDRICPTAARILVIPENHTRNQFYLESLATLISLIDKAGFEVRIGSLLTGLEQAQSIELPSGRSLLLEPLRREQDRLKVGSFDPCLILLNNDLSSGAPELLQNLAQPILPPISLGWSHRTKSNHFALYHEVAQEIAQVIGMDPWLIDPYFRNCGQVDFLRKEGLDCLESNVATLLTQIQQKYDEYGIDKTPFVIIKADAGTYGMNVMTVNSVAEIAHLNRKQRTKMSSGKEGLAVSRVLIQEGVHTIERWGDEQVSAEPVVYMVDNTVVGGFYRVHHERGPTENLNAPGMKFHPVAFRQCCNTPDKSLDAQVEINRFYVYGVVARLALLAAAREAIAVYS